MKKLNIITVGYNEESNLDKLFLSFTDIKQFLDVNVIYIDQSSSDRSFEIAKKYTNQVYIHENKGFCEPDKKWAYDVISKDSDWCLFLDADEELTKEVSHEIIEIVNNSSHDAYEFIIEIRFLGIIITRSKQLRLVKKGTVKITDTVHNWIQKESANIGILKNKIINRNLKEEGKDKNEINIWIDKMNRYTDKEIEKLKCEKISSFQILIKMLIMPIIHFFGFLIINGGIQYGIKGLIYSFLAGFYQFIIYSKLYEYNYKNHL